MRPSYQIDAARIRASAGTTPQIVST